jgi:hypothetical protein
MKTNTLLKTDKALAVIKLILLGAFAAAPASGQCQTLNTRIGKLGFTHDFANGYPTRETVE